MSLLDPLWTLVFYGFVVLLFVGGLFALWESVGLFRDVLAMVLTRTSPTTAVREGRVEVSGTVEAAGETLTDPVTGADCVAYEYRVTEEESFKDDAIDWTRWGYREQAEGGIATRFRVADETGEVVVDPGDPDADHQAYDGVVNLYATDKESVHVEDDSEGPASLAALRTRIDLGKSTDKGRMYASAPIAPGDPVYVLGTASLDGDERVIAGGDDRFVVAGAGQLRTLVYNAGWGLTKFAVGLVLALGIGLFLLSELLGLVGIDLWSRLVPLLPF